jgi:hypothetical protein
MPLDARSRLCLVRVKVERAKKHLCDLEKDLTEYRGSSYTVIGPAIGPKTGTPLSGADRTLHTLPMIPFDAIAASGDIIQNLRSSLDHLAYQLVMVGTNDAGPKHVRRIQFPIAEDFGAYETRKAGQVEGMRDDAKLAIDAVKPYKDGNDNLWRIHELNNIDKHRCLFTVAQDHLFVADWLPELPGLGPFWYKAKDLTFAGVFGGNMDERFQAEIDRACSNANVVRGDALLPTLHQLVTFTDTFVRSFLPLLQ